MPPKSASNDFTAELQKGIEVINKNIDTKLEDHQKSTEAHMSKTIKNFEVKLNELVSQIREDFLEEITKIKSDVNHCYEFIKQIDKSTTSRFIELEKSQNLIMRRLNRLDVIITGLPAASPKLKTMILKLAEVYSVPFGENDIKQYTSIKNNSEVLVQFHSIAIRDAIIKKYYETRTLMLKDLLSQEENEDGADLEARVFLSDHLTPMASKLCYICRQLKKSNRITGFKFRNGNEPHAVIKMRDGAHKTLDIFSLMDKFPEFKTS